MAERERLLPLRIQHRLLLLRQRALLLGQPLHAPEALQGGRHRHALLALRLILRWRRARKAWMQQSLVRVSGSGYLALHRDKDVMSL